MSKESIAIYGNVDEAIMHEKKLSQPQRNADGYWIVRYGRGRLAFDTREAARWWLRQQRARKERER